MGIKGRYLVFGAGLLALLALGLALWAQRGPREVAGLLDSATLQESVQTQVTRGAGEAANSGGATDKGQVTERVEYVIRDASGRIKEQKSIGGQ